MDEDLYDEFGNLIGNPEDSDAESSASSEFHEFEHEDNVSGELPDADDKPDRFQEETRIILQEDKKIFSTMTETFGEDVETIVQTYDNQSINEPLLKPTVEKFFKIEDKKLPKTVYSKEYLVQLLTVPSKVRNVSLVGGLNSGKTSFLDTLILQTHELKKSKTKNFKKLRYTDNTKLEIERGITMKASPTTLLLPNIKGNSMILNILDTPGHIDFVDEVSISQRITDISVVVVDVIEGLTIGAKKAIDNALQNNLQLAFIINKIDRLVLELRLPPSDSFHKIRNTIDEINLYVEGNQFYLQSNHKTSFSPKLNNVIFASAELNFSFTLKSFAKLYSDNHGYDLNINEFAKRLWGDIYYDKIPNKFSKNGEIRSFVYFILEPIYKIITSVLSKKADVLEKIIYENFGVRISKEVLKSDSQILLKEVFGSIFSDASGFVDVIENLNSPEKNLKASLFTGQSSEILNYISLSSKDGPLVAEVCKMIDYDVGLVRIYSGTLIKGNKVQILGENFNEDDEDFEIKTVSELYVSCGRYKIPINEAPAGSIVLLGGLESISKSASIFDLELKEDQLSTFRTIDYLNKAVFKVVIEPQVPTELPKLLDGLRKTNKSYASVEIKVEESGEHVIFGSGELYLDSFLHDLRHITDINIKISDPITKFSETIIDSSFTKISIKSQNEQNEITIIAEPLEEDLASDVEKGKLPLSIRKLNKVLKDRYGWDSLAARSLWSFGPNSTGPNAILDDSLPEDVDKQLLNSLKDPIIQGFQWAVKEGPLADEPIRNIKFKIIDAKFSEDPLQRNNGQIIPMVRRACYSAVLTSTPRLMEPVYAVEIISSISTLKIIEKLLDKRRGAILRDEPIAATKLYKINGFIPVIDSVGFETDVRVATQGEALVSQYFDKWNVVPGDPLDKDLFIPKLKPAPIQSLARDFIMKIRKRKGLVGEPSLAKYIDRELVQSLRELGLLE